VTEEFKRLLADLGDEELRQIALAKMEGYTNQEIAARMDLTLRTVERRLALIRGRWTRKGDEP
jgi:DNA-directed RNA polymerase specialized sigma24 family protein